MAIDFHYVPFPPEPISGESVLEQTEQAINELGAQIETGVSDATTIAQEALDTANSADATANSALQQAQSAQTTADNATTVANQAQADATAALTTATTAQGRADDAFDKAAIADTNATQALTTANAAQSEASQAQTTANTALQQSENANNSANSSLSMAKIAVGVFTVEAETVDANNRYAAAEKLFLTNTGNTNFPLDITMPAWLMVYIVSDGTSVTQTCWDDMTTSRIYTRTAEINNSDPANPVVTWSPWNSVATPTVIKSVTVEIDPAGQPPGTYLVIVSDTETGEVTSYVNLSDIIGAGYTAGNGAIYISADNKISLQLDPTGTGASISDAGLKITTGETTVGDIQLKPFRIDALPSGWYFCNGDQYALSSPQGMALNSLPYTFKTDWGITVTGDNISLPNMFNVGGRGFFLRPVNGVAQQVGAVSDDTMRPITGQVAYSPNNGFLRSTDSSASGCFFPGSVLKTQGFTGDTGQRTWDLGLDSSLLGPNYSGTETAPTHRGMTPAIYLGV